MSFGKRDRLDGLVGSRYVLLEVEVEPGVAVGLDSPLKVLLPERGCGLPKPKWVIGGRSITRYSHGGNRHKARKDAAFPR